MRRDVAGVVALADRDDDRILEREAYIFGRYLIKRDPPPLMVTRYAAANRRLSRRGVYSAEAGLLAFVVQHPWSLPFLDAACGLLRPDALLRKKILAMAAVLEASLTFASEFLPRTVPWPVLLGELVSCASGTVVKVAIGAVPLPIAWRKRP